MSQKLEYPKLVERDFNWGSSSKNKVLEKKISSKRFQLQQIGKKILSVFFFWTSFFLQIS